MNSLTYRRYSERNSLILWTLLILTLNNGISINKVVASQPTNCSQVKCPPLSEIVCPDDSFARETNEETNVVTSPDHSEIVEEVFIQCCVTKKCACRVCHIPSCHNSSLVLNELTPETEIPGKCCGTYECITEPDCTETEDTENHWLIDCQRCKCSDGERQCDRVCDESIIQIAPPESTVATCFSQNLNRFFSPGDSWKEDDDCMQCECIDGQKKCHQICDETLNNNNCISHNSNRFFSNGDKWNEDNCTHCECVSGEKICHHVCEFIGYGPSNCISQNLNRSFSNGDSWKEDDCTYCECENGVKRCHTSFCQSLNCHNFIKIAGQCCPTCVSGTELFNTTIATVITTTTEDVVNTTVKISSEPPAMIVETNHTALNELNSTTTIAPTTETTDVPIISVEIPREENKQENIEIPIVIPEITSTPSPLPCYTQSPAVTYSIQDSNGVQQAFQPSCVLYVSVVTILSLLIFIFGGLYFYERSKRRSYNPVSPTDDNYNKINIKPIMEDDNFNNIKINMKQDYS